MPFGHLISHLFSFFYEQVNRIFYVTFLIFVSGHSHENQAVSQGETANYNSTTKLQHFVRNDIREDNETVIESTIDEEISSSSVATRSMLPFIF